MEKNLFIVSGVLGDNYFCTRSLDFVVDDDCKKCGLCTKPVVDSLVVSNVNSEEGYGVCSCGGSIILEGWRSVLKNVHTLGKVVDVGCSATLTAKGYCKDCSKQHSFKIVVTRVDENKVLWKAII